MSHAKLVSIAAKWLKSFGCSLVIKELVCTTRYREIPDVIGWKSGESILIECKTSISDFHADKRKFFRAAPENGMGSRRLYLCPEGVIMPTHLPQGWGLLWVDGKKIKRVIAPKGNYFPHDGPCSYFYKRCKDSEITMLLSVIRRSKKNNAH